MCAQWAVRFPTARAEVVAIVVFLHPPIFLAFLLTAKRPKSLFALAIPFCHRVTSFLDCLVHSNAHTNRVSNFICRVRNTF